MENRTFSRGIVSVLVVLALLLPPAAALPPEVGGPDAGPLVDDRGVVPVPTATASAKTDVPDVYEVLFGGKVLGERVGEQVAGVGDVNNDGYDDFVVLSATRGLCYVYMGGKTVTQASVRMLEGTGLTVTEESQVRPAGDIDNDGFADVLVSSPAFYLPSTRAAGAMYVFYGTPSGLQAKPDQILFGREVDGRFGISIDGLGDLDKDGYTDVIVGSDGVDHDRGRVQIFMGGPRGLDETPSWTWDGENQGDRFGHAVTGAGDLNGDGWLDFAIGAPSAVAGDSRGKVYVFNGKPSLDDVRVSKVLQGQMLRSYFGLSIRLAGDVNNDGFSDLVVSSPDASSGEFPGAGRVELYVGSEHGIVDKAVRVIEGESTGSHLGFTIAYLGDVNRDGCDDVAIGAQLFSSGGMAERGKVYVFFGDRYSGFSAEAKVEEMGTSAGQHLSAGLAGAGDVDGDGFADMLVGVPGFDLPNTEDVGAALLFRGSDMTMPPLIDGAVRVEDTTEDGLLLSEHHFYHLVVAVTHRTDVRSLGNIELHLDPRGADVIYTYSVATDRITETWDPSNLATVGSASIGEDPVTRDTFDLWVELRLGWRFPADRPLEVRAVAIDKLGLRVEGVWGELGRVVNSLTFTGGLTATGDEQGLLSEGGWVRGGEGITFGGVVVAYDLSQTGRTTTGTYHPPTGSVRVVGRDDMGGTWSVSPSPGVPIALGVRAPTSTRTDIVYTLSIETPDGSRVFRTMARAQRVDATPVAFGGAWPTEVVASLRVTASIVVTDPLGPGVEATSVEYQVALAGGTGAFGEWTQASVVVEGESVSGLASLLLTEGTSFIRWRARDTVGNGPTASFIYPIKVDLGNITFTAAAPTETVWFDTSLVTAGITVENTKGNPIDLEHVQYRVSTSPGVFTEWASVPVDGSGDVARVTVQVGVQLAEGRSNYIQWRARDTVRREYITSPLYRVQVDLTGPTFHDPSPSEDVFVGERNAIAVRVSVQDPLSGVQEGSVRYQVYGDDVWHVPTIVRLGSTFECLAVVNLPEGRDNYVIWTALDVAGHLSAQFQQRVMVDNTAPVFSGFAPSPSDVMRLRLVELSFRVDDYAPDGGRGSGVDLRTLEYSVSRPTTGGYSEWRRVGKYSDLEVPVVPFYMVSFTVELDTSDENYVVLRITDATGANTATSEPHRILVELGFKPMPPVPIIREPRDTSVDYGSATYFDASESYDPNGDELAFQWRSSIDGVLSNDASFSAILSEGRHTITLTVREADGDLSEKRTFDIDVQPPKEPHQPLSSLWEQVAVLLIALCIIIALIMQAARIRL